MISDKPLTARQVDALKRLEMCAIILRDFLMDHEELNHLIEGEEHTDQKLHSYLLMAIDSWNTITPITITADIFTFPSLTLLIEGAAIWSLKSAIFRYLRNAFQYNDSGVQVAVEEKAAEYERTLQRALTEWETKALKVKEHINLEGCYGGFSSEYLELYIIGRRSYR